MNFEATNSKCGCTGIRYTW